MKSIKENEFSMGWSDKGGSVNYQPSLGTHVAPNNEPGPARFKHTLDKKGTGSKAEIKSKLKKIFSQKIVPTSDEIRAGIDYELHNMTTPNKLGATITVLDNLLEDPEYYKNLQQLNIDDKKMVKHIKVNENLKNIFKDLTDKRNNKYYINPNLKNVIQDMIEQKKNKRIWK